MKRILRFLLGLSVVSPGVMPAAHAAEGADAAYIVTYIEVMPPAKDKALGLLRQFGKASRKDPGNVRFEVLQRIGTPNHFAILEAWVDQKAQAAHGMAAHTKEFREKLRPYLRPQRPQPHPRGSVPQRTPVWSQRPRAVVARTFRRRVRDSPCPDVRT